MGDDGVIGKIPATSVKAYDIYAAASFPSMISILLDIGNSPSWICVKGNWFASTSA